MVRGGPSVTFDSIVFSESKPSVLFIDQEVSAVIHPRVCVDGCAGVCVVGAGVGVEVVGAGVGTAEAPTSTTASTKATFILSDGTARRTGELPCPRDNR